MTERDPETQGSDVAEATEDEANQPGQLMGVFLLFRDLWRLFRGEDQRTRKLRWLFGLLRPYRGRVIVMVVALLIATAAGLAPPYLAGLAIDEGIRTGDLSTLDWIVAAFVLSAVMFWAATYAQTYLVGLGRAAGAAGPARADLHAPPDDVDRLLHAAQAGRADLADDQRRRGARHAGHRRVDHARLEHAHARWAWCVILLFLDFQLALVTFATFPILAIGSVIFRIASAGAYRRTREKIANITAYLQETLSGVRVVRSFAQEPRHLRRMCRLNEENRQANMATVYLNAAYFPAVELLSAIGTASDPALRRLSGRSRATSRSASSSRSSAT